MDINSFPQCISIEDWDKMRIEASNNTICIYDTKACKVVCYLDDHDEALCTADDYRRQKETSVELLDMTSQHPAQKQFMDNLVMLNLMLHAQLPPRSPLVEECMQFSKTHVPNRKDVDVDSEEFQKKSKERRERLHKRLEKLRQQLPYDPVDPEVINLVRLILRRLPRLQQPVLHPVDDSSVDLVWSMKPPKFATLDSEGIVLHGFSTEKDVVVSESYDFKEEGFSQENEEDLEKLVSFLVDLLRKFIDSGVPTPKQNNSEQVVN